MSDPGKQPDKSATHYFLLGPSGIGKTWIGNWIEDNRNHLHITIDRGDDPDVPEEFTELSEQLAQGNPTLIARELDKLATAAGKKNCVLTFKSVEFIDPQEIAKLADQRIAVKYLYGPKEKCIDAFVSREKANGHSERDRSFWCTNNGKYQRMGGPGMADYSVWVFDSSGNRLSEAEIATLLGIE